MGAFWSSLFVGALGGLVSSIVAPLVIEFSKEAFLHRKQKKDAIDSLVAAATKLEFDFEPLYEVYSQGGSCSETASECRALKEFAYVLASARVFLPDNVVSLAALAVAQCREDLKDISSDRIPRSMLDQSPDALKALYEKLNLPNPKLFKTIQNEAREELARSEAVTTSPK